MHYIFIAKLINTEYIGISLSNSPPKKEVEKFVPKYYIT